MKGRGVFIKRMTALVLTAVMLLSGIPFPGNIKEVNAAGMTEEQRKAVALTAEPITDGYRLKNGYFEIETGKYGQLTSIQIVDDLYPTNYVMNTQNAPGQDTAAHQWMGELMFQTRPAGSDEWDESMTSKSDSVRNVELIDNKVVITYENATEEKGINDFKLVESYYLEDDQLKWDITVENNNASALEIGDFGVPLAFNEYWPGGEEIYETRVMDHSFIGKDSSYIYATRPSGLGQFLLMTPDVETGAGFEYQDHWRVEERSGEEAAWCQDQSGWANGLNVYYIHSQVIQKTNRGYLENTSLTLQPGESKTYGFSFSIADNEDDMKSILYEEGIIDAVAVPGMAFSKNMPAKMYLHTIYDAEDISLSVKCPHELDLHQGNPNTVCNMLDCQKTPDNTKVSYLETKVIDGEQYHIYELSFADLGQNDISISYDNGKKETELQFYIMDDVEEALNTHSDFMVEKTQWDAEGEVYDKVFDDWMMDERKKRGEFYGYWGWGDDWGLTHGEYIAEKNVFIPVAKEIKAVDEYLDVAIWNGLMQEHQEDYLIHDFLMDEPNTTPTYRGYAYAHIYNTYYSMYKIASKYPDMVDYIEDADTYLLRAYNILKALYSDGVAYNWATGIMGELTTPDIIQSLKKEGYYEEASNIEAIMATKYDNFKNTKYPYGSEYSYDNTGEEAVYTLAKLNLSQDTANANNMMRKIDAKTRACRGLQPIWYHYANPTTICGENWWNFQYTAALAGYCMDDYLRLQDNHLNATERAKAERVNYAAKLANLTCINSGQIDADPGNIGTVSWTYQSEMGNLGGQGTGGGSLHNGWRQMAGEADLGLFGALQILSADVANDPVFGVFGYGCEVDAANGMYRITPLDGLQTRLNLIEEQLYIELDRDKYTYAEVAKDCTEVELTIKNLEKTEHNTEVSITGLEDGAYSIVVAGQEAGTFKAEKGKTSTISVPLPKADTVNISLKSGASIANKAPVVNAGTDKELFLPAHDGMDSVTLVMDVKLTASQENNTRLFEFGDMNGNYLYVSFKNGNQMYLSATDMATGELNTVDTEVQVAPDYWKNIAVTVKEGDIFLYVDGYPAKEIADSGFTFSGFGTVQRNFLGRSADDSIGFLQGYIDNFEMYSYAMTAEEIADKYGDGRNAELVSVEPVTLITPVGEPAVFPETVRGLYSNGLYRDVNVEWDEVDSSQYETAGKFDVEGRIVTAEGEMDEAPDLNAIAHVLVVDGTVQNLASFATPTAIIDTPSDLGGVAGLNDGYEPASSRDTSHGVWHNWHGDQGGEAWVQYTWEEEVIITSQGAYYFTDGNFAPASVSLFYLNQNNEWIEMKGVKGLGVDLDRYNTTTFDAVATKGIRMVMNPKTLGVGVIEWKVYGYSDRKVLDKTNIKDAIAWAEGLNAGKVAEGFDGVQTALQNAIAVRDNAESTQEALDAAADTLYAAIAACKPVDDNLAYKAKVETSFVSAWESLDAVKDGQLPASSMEKTVSAYGTWGNTSEYETITYKWPANVKIENAGIYLWTDGGGILFPASYEYSYWNGESWATIQNAEGLGLEADKMNVTAFPGGIETTQLQVKLNKQAADYNGVGVFEWVVSGGAINEEEPGGEEPEGEPGEEPAEDISIPEGSINLAPSATASGSHDKTDDGGGVAELNDEDDALLGASSSTENGFWHNWEGFGEDAWVQYTWDKAVSLTGMDLYYFATWEGFQTKEIKLSYLDEEGNWIPVSDAKGMGTKLDQWNTTVFASPITTTSLKMVLTPVSNSVGILEWKVYGKTVEASEEENNLEPASVFSAGKTDDTADGQTIETVVVDMPEYQTENVQLPEVKDLVEETLEAIQTGIARSRLRASVVDDGYPNMSLTYHWEVASAPDGSNTVIEHTDKPITNVTFDKAGTYELKLTVSDGELSGTDTVVYEVKQDEELPKLIAHYDFSQEKLDAEEREVVDVSGSHYNARYSYNPNPKFATVDEREVLSMDGGFCGYVKLTNELTLGRVTAEKEKISSNNPGGGSVDVDNSDKDNHHSEQDDSGNDDDESEQNNASVTAPAESKKQTGTPNTGKAAAKNSEQLQKADDVQEIVPNEPTSVKETGDKDASAEKADTTPNVADGEEKNKIMLEDEESPLGVGNLEDNGGFLNMLPIILGAVCVALLAVFLTYKKSKREKEEI